MKKGEKDLINSSGQLSQLVIGLGTQWKPHHSHLLAEERIILEGEHSDSQNLNQLLNRILHSIARN